jgi:CBS domain containing-hemolysin-like protein
VDHDITIKLFFLFILLLLSGFFSGSEASLFSLTTLHLHKIKEDKNPFFSYVKKLLASPRRLLITIIVCNDSVNITIAALTTSIFLYLFGIDGKWMAIAVTTLTLLIFGDAIPKTFAVNYPIKFSTSVSLPLTFFSRIVRPIVWVLEKISDLFVHLFGKTVPMPSSVLTEDEFITLVDVGHQEGALEESQKDLIHRVFELADTTVSDVIIPRVDMFCLPISMTAEEMGRQIIKSRYSRIPVYGTDRDDILGILHAKYLLKKISKESNIKTNIKKLLKEPYFVPLERSIESMLRDFQIRKIQMAIVVDEYGGVAGIVTLTDIMKNLFADIYDEYNVRKNLFYRVDDGTVMVSGAMDIADFNELIETAIPEEDFDTVGGFIFHLFGKLPARGDEVDFEIYTFKVEKISKTRIMTVRVTRKHD